MYMDMLHSKWYAGAQFSSRLWGCGSLETSVPVQVSSSDRGSKLRGPSQNGPSVASKRVVNITKLNNQIKVLIANTQRINTHETEEQLLSVCFDRL
ncbi:hypothetical protein AVEN_7701-1 [Araneus ventricosus]|uniref:Uncharacterized protein n=1 Tax=Araneus ventricosus TaxID=182803 RepID=A0A4Y2G2F1_ARAVE|nr:hypothetical protein AVEN_7701-1 [Araneus ventricosus]